MKLAWSAIVKNEAVIIERCVKSLLPYVDCGIVVDTGSDDGTPGLIHDLFGAAGKPVEVHRAPFENFAQARNVALQAARNSPLEFDYLLLSDADMELVVEDPSWTKKLNGGPAYDVKQVAGTLTYWNKRLLNRSAEATYQCVTHEYLDAPTAGNLDGVWFRDYTDGSNRPGKLERDVALLEDALKTETRPGLIERIHFYLANSLFDLGNWMRAAEHYRIRVGLGGFGEECWYAQMRLAMCLGSLGDQPGYVWAMLEAYRMRPWRAETLYELAKFFRERGDNFSSLLFSEAGMQLPHGSSDVLFVNDWIRTQGLKEEFAICAFYSKRHFAAGAKTCDRLALAGSVQARSNQYWYLRPLNEAVLSFRAERIAFTPPEGYVACNPSVINYNGQPLILVRTVNYTINADGGYDIRDGDGACANRNPIWTRNFLVYPQSSIDPAELPLPESSPLMEYPLVRGFEDSRLFRWNKDLWTISTVREWNKDGWCEQVLAPVTGLGGYGRWQKILPKERRHEKNWMPWVQDGELRFVYRLGTLVDTAGAVVASHDCGMDVGSISGGSQVVTVDERTNLAIVHEAYTIPGRTNRYYQHRFVNFHRTGRVDRISAPFVFFDRRIEFAAGMALFGKQLMVSFGVMDREAWTATMDVDEVIQFLYRDAL